MVGLQKLSPLVRLIMDKQMQKLNLIFNIDWNY